MMGKAALKRPPRSVPPLPRPTPMSEIAMKVLFLEKILKRMIDNEEIKALLLIDPDPDIRKFAQDGSEDE